MNFVRMEACGGSPVELESIRRGMVHEAELFWSRLKRRRPHVLFEKRPPTPADQVYLL